MLRFLAFCVHVLLVVGLSPRPLVLWHGLGDSYSSPGMLEFVSKIKEVHPGIFVHSIYLDQDLDKDRQAGFVRQVLLCLTINSFSELTRQYGNVNEQVEFVHEQLAAIPELAHGFDAIGLSQGGQFLRAYVERYNLPPIHNLLTFGSQHMGISDLPVCRPFDVFCQIARRATKQAVYSPWAQENSVQAQYFRDPTNIDAYMSANHFLASINNEVPLLRNGTYAKNLASLNALILILFTQDKTVVPKESAWFGSEAVSDEQWGLFGRQRLLTTTQDRSSIVPMHLQPLYIEDWIGLRMLDEQGRVAFATCEGEHMVMSECWEVLVRTWTGELV